MTFPLSQKLGDVKKSLAEEFGVSEHQRIFYMGRELKSGGRSLERLGLGRSGNNVLHMHIPPTTTAADNNSSKNSKSASGTKRRRAPVPSLNQVSSSGSISGPSSGEGGIIEIVDSDDEVSKRRR